MYKRQLQIFGKLVNQILLLHNRFVLFVIPIFYSPYNLPGESRSGQRDEMCIRDSMEGQRNVMIGIDHDEVVYVPFTKAIKNETHQERPCKCIERTVYLMTDCSDTP